MGRNLQKFILLTWKNWLLQWRHPIQTAIEILAPVLFAALLVLIRSLVDPEERDTRTYPEFSPNPLSERQLLLSNSLDLSAFTKATSEIPNNILWSPCGNDALALIMDSVVKNFVIFTQTCTENATELQRLMQINPGQTFAGVQFDDRLASQNSIDKDIRVILRYSGELRTNGSTTSFLNMWFTHLIFPLYQMPGPRDESNDYGAVPNYFFEGFLMLQHAISTAIIEHHMENGHVQDQILPIIKMQRFPYPPWISDFLLEALKSFVGIIIMLSFVYTCINTVRVITNEKETQLKEAMKIMGLPNWLHWTAWFLKIFIFLLLSVILMVVLLKVSWYPNTNYSVFTYTDGFVLFVFMLFYMFSTITFCFAISVFFSKANTAATIAGLAWFLSYCPYLFLQEHYNNLSLSAKLAAMLGSNTAMAYGFQLIVMFEGTGEGLQWHNIFSSVNPDDNFTLAHVIMMLIVDTIIYLIIALYVESVFPGEYGVPQRWYYPFTYSYWCGQPRYSGVEDRAANRIEESDIYEKEPMNLPAGIKIRHLRKMYSNKKVAVRDLSLNMFEGQITVLLGHNGAGKTTTMSMLTGMLPPSGGTAIINGYDIRTDMTGIRDSLGLCPQHNILFDELTVKEHFYFFSKLKGMTNKKEIDAEIKKYIELLELVPKTDAKSKTLSGGMKRKLCVGIALCGKSKVCMFDEPTAGMDPAARRALWDLMQQQKKDRTILLSTHFMDEADLLGDRIAIMAGGQLQCCGTSFFLKKKYGAGYYLVMEKLPKCNVNEVTNVLRRHIPSIQVQNDIGSELTYLLAKEQATVFQEMLQDFETRAQDVGIANFGISLTTMEEVFMKVGADHGQEEENDALENANGHVDLSRENGENGYKHTSDTKLNINEDHVVTGFALKINQLIAMMMKKVLSTLRSWVLFLIQNIIPVAFLIIAILVARVMTNDMEPARLDLSLDPFHNPVTTFTTTKLDNPFYKQYLQTFIKEGREYSDWKLGNFTKNILELGEEIITTIRMRYIFGAIFDDDKIVTLFNNEPYHSPPLALEYTMNTVLRTKMQSPDYSIRFTNYPLPYTAETQANRMQQGNTMGFQLAFNIGFSMAFVSSFYILFYVRERVNKSKHLQFVSGANVAVYWITAYVWDFLTFVFTSLCLIATMACFQEAGFSTFDELGRVFLLLILFGLAMLPQTYLLAFRFEVPSTGYTRITLINILLGVAAFMVVQTLAVEGLNLEHVANGLHWPFLLVPHYAVASGIQDMHLKFSINMMCDTFDGLQPGVPDAACNTIAMCCDRDDNFLGWDNRGIGRNITFLCITATVLTVILMLIEYRVFEKVIYLCRKQIARTPPTDGVDDTDVEDEKRRVKDGEINKKEYSVVLKDVTKYYDNFVAVNQLNLGIKGGECFGLLGVNGAGKTTTFKMMTGDIPISSGDAWIYGLNAKTEMKNVHKHIGYCPQFDALLDDLTGKETLIMYCLLRGIPFAESKYIAHNLAREFDFYRHINKQVREYSGGNKRKLSAAVASIGDPPIVFLDEPTTGMDPATKRNLWNTLCRIRESGKCLVLTSHSMEECEALCTRLAIMVNGTFKCLGTTQHLKNKFSQGYTLTAKVKKPGANLTLETSDVEPIERFVKGHFPSAILRESHQELVTFYIPDTAGLKWSKMFGLMEEAKQALNIEDYSIGQSSLEQVFLHFTKFQREE